MKKKIVFCTVAILFLLLLVSIIHELWGSIEHWRLESRVGKAGAKLTRILRSNPRYDGVNAAGWAHSGGLIQCDGFVINTNDYETLSNLFIAFSSNNFPVLNWVYVRSETNK